MSIRAGVYTVEKIGKNRELTPEGFLLCRDVPVARTGMMLYGPDEIEGATPGPDGIIKAHRSEDDVFDDKTIRSALGKPITNDHPDGDVNPENWKKEAHGVALNVRRGEGIMDDLLLMDLLFTTEEGIEAVQNGKREISLGYDANYEEMAEGEYRQFNIIINHIALVEEGRCGPRCAIKDKQTIEETIVAKKDDKRNKTGMARILDLIMRASKTKDAEELSQVISDAVEDDELALGNQQGGAEKVEGARTSFTDDDIKAHMDQNAKEHEEFRTQIAELKKLVGGGTSDKKEEEEKPTDDEMIEDSLAEEAPEGQEGMARKAKDSAFLSDSFTNTVSLAEILVPGIRVPTYDRKSDPKVTFKKICGLRRQALDLAYGQAETRGIIDDVLGGKKLDTVSMTCDAIRTLFNSAASVKKSTNNSARTSIEGMYVANKQMTLDDVEKLNKEYYAKHK